MRVDSGFRFEGYFFCHFQQENRTLLYRVINIPEKDKYKVHNRDGKQGYDALIYVFIPYRFLHYVGFAYRVVQMDPQPAPKALDILIFFEAVRELFEIEVKYIVHLPAELLCFSFIHEIIIHRKFQCADRPVLIYRFLRKKDL